MKFLLFMFLMSSQAMAVDIKISQLPLGTASSTGTLDSFPYVDANAGVTRRLKLSTLISLPSMQSTFAPISSPTFTGTVTAPNFVGFLTGSVAGNVTGNLTGNVTGNVSGSAGSFTGNLSGDVTGTQSATAISASTVTGKLITGFVSGAGTVSSSDTILSAIDKLDGNVAGKQTSGNYITGLTSDVSATGPGIPAATVNSVGGSSASNVNAATILANAATDANTASAIVRRDSSGNFTAGSITATIIGNASTATTATNIGTTATSTNSSFFPLFVSSSSTSNQAARMVSGISLNPSTSTVTATTFSGALSGNATTATTAVNVSGVVAEIHGGTNQSSYTTGDILYASGTNTLSVLAKGSTGQLLTQGASIPSWSTPVWVVSAKIDSSGTVTSENGNSTDWINGNCVVSGTSIFTCTLQSGIFSVAPNCVGQVDQTNVAGFINFNQNAASASAVNYRTFNESAVLTARGIAIMCQGTH